jgi:hypothetical protein
MRWLRRRDEPAPGRDDAARLLLPTAMRAGIPARPVSYVDREQMGQLFVGAQPGTPVVLLGPAGSGTTHLAAEYARFQLARDLPVYWLSAHTVNAVRGGLATVTGALSLADPTDDATTAVAWLRHQSPGAVLVADGAAGLDSVAPLLSLTDRVCLVVTTSDESLRELPGAIVVPVGELDADAAAAHLARRGGVGEAAARTVVEELGGLALTVTLAATGIRVGGGGVEAYLDRVRALAAEADIPPATAVIRLAVEAVTGGPADADLVADIMARHLAVLSRGGVHAELLEYFDLTAAILIPTADAVGHRAAALARFVAEDLVSASAGPNSVIMHELVQRAILDTCEPARLGAMVAFGLRMLDALNLRPRQLSPVEHVVWEHTLVQLDALVAAAARAPLDLDEYGIGLAAELNSHRASAAAYLLGRIDAVRAEPYVADLAPDTAPLARWLRERSAERGEDPPMRRVAPI